mmetsp:Transcript_12337/g.17574  ORF Transcript_12337/g.17574 Transcript_12337/m.17574 type:complete len:143 (+) Transcript_12337:430-858(+)
MQKRLDLISMKIVLWGLFIFLRSSLPQYPFKQIPLLSLHLGPAKNQINLVLKYLLACAIRSIGKRSLTCPKSGANETNLSGVVILRATTKTCAMPGSMASRKAIVLNFSAPSSLKKLENKQTFLTSPSLPPNTIRHRPQNHF